MTAKCTGEMQRGVTKCTRGRERIDAKRQEDIHRDKVVSSSFAGSALLTLDVLAASGLVFETGEEGNECCDSSEVMTPLQDIFMKYISHQQCTVADSPFLGVPNPDF